MNNYPLISVILLNWNRLDDTRRAIDSVLAQTYANLEIVLVDNHSDESGLDILIKQYPMVRAYEMDKNYGCPGGRNIGINLSKGEYLFFVDNDGILESHAISNAYEIFRKNENVGIVAGKVIYVKDVTEVDRTILPEVAENHYAPTFSGGVSMHKRTIYDAIGMYNPDFMYGGEETNLSLRLLTMDQYVFYADNVILWHKRSEAARPKQFNFISSCSNIYHTYMKLMPAEFRILFFIYFTFKYPLYAWKKGLLIPFLKAMPGIYKRKVLPNTLNKEIRLKREHVYLDQLLIKKRFTAFEELIREKLNYSYWRYLHSLIFFKMD